MKPLSQCRVCAGPVVFAFSAREMMLGTGDVFDYVECEGCGCLQIAVIPSSLDRYYGKAYYTHNQRKKRLKARGVCSFRKNWTRLRLGDSHLARICSGRRYARFAWFRRTQTGLHDGILDVGCGSGRLLARLHREGFDRLTGIDVREDAHQSDLLATSLRIERSSAEDHVGQYHLVMAHHSFEHMPDPVSAFAAFARLVEPGGYLLLRAPVADSWARRKYAADWVQLDAPRHLHLHTRRSIDLLARRSGFQLTHIVDDSGPFQIWGSELYRRNISLVEAGRGGSRLIDRLRARYQARKLARQGLGDQACFYLQRVE